MEISWEYTTHTLTNTCDALVVGECPRFRQVAFMALKRNGFTATMCFFSRDFLLARWLNVALLDGLLGVAGMMTLRM